MDHRCCFTWKTEFEFNIKDLITVTIFLRWFDNRWITVQYTSGTRTGPALTWYTVILFFICNLGYYMICAVIRIGLCLWYAYGLCLWSCLNRSSLRSWIVSRKGFDPLLSFKAMSWTLMLTISIYFYLSWMLMNAEYLLNRGFMHGVSVRGLKSWFAVIHSVLIW